MNLTFEPHTVPQVYDAYDEDPELVALIRLCMAAEGNEDGDFNERAAYELDKLEASEVYVVRGDTARILGLLAVNVSERNEAKTLLIEAIAVDARLRDRKIGSKILHFAEILALDHGCTSVQAYALDDDKVIGFYERQGYDELSMHGAYVHMAKAIS